MKTGLRGLRACVPLFLPVLAAGAGTITVTPNNESVVVNGTRQMTAAVSGLMNNSVTWTVNGGSIDANGLYTAPPTVPNPASVTVTATSMADPTVSGSAVLNIKQECRAGDYIGNAF